MDLDPASVDSIRCSPSIGQLFSPDSIVCSSGATSGNNWAKGYYTEGSDLIDSIMDQIRREVEQADCM